MWLYLVAGDHAARPDADRTQACQSARHAAASSPRQCTRRAELPRVHLHRALVHEDLREELPQLVGTLHFWSKDGGWPVDGSCDRCTTADRHRLLDSERFGSRVYPPFHFFTAARRENRSFRLFALCTRNCRFGDSISVRCLVNFQTPMRSNNMDI